MSKATEEIVEAAHPRPFKKGRFNLYKTPDGGFHIAYQEDPTEENPDPEIQHMDIPGPVIRAAEMMSSGKMKPTQVLKMFAGMVTS